MTNELHNILANPYLETDDTLRVVRHDPARYPPQIIYTPRSWLWTQDIETGENGTFNGDPNSFIVPTVWPQGEPPVMTIEAAYKRFRVVFEQANVPLKAGQTYVLKMISIPELRLTQGTAEDTIRAYAFVTWNGRTYMLPVQGVNSWGVENENVWSIKANEAMQVNVGFGVWSVWSNIDGRIRLPSLEMLEVGENYPPMLELGQAKPAPSPTPQPAFNLVPWLLGALIIVLGVGIGVWLFSNFYFLRGLEVDPMADFLTDLFARIDVLAYLPFTAAVVLYLTEVLKRLELRFVADKWRVHPRIIGLTLTVLAWTGYAVAKQVGYGLAYEQAFGIIEGIVKVLGPVLLGTLLTTGTMQVTHNRLQAWRWPGFESRWPKSTTR